MARDGGLSGSVEFGQIPREQGVRVRKSSEGGFASKGPKEGFRLTGRCVAGPMDRIASGLPEITESIGRDRKMLAKFQHFLANSAEPVRIVR